MQELSEEEKIELQCTTSKQAKTCSLFLTEPTQDFFLKKMKKYIYTEK